MDYSLDDYIEQIGLLHQDEQVVDACIEQHSDAATAAKTNIIERQRRQANTHIIFLSHRSVGNDGLDKLVHAILSANERQMETECRRHRISNDNRGSLQQANGNMYLAKKIHLRCTNIKRGINSLASLLSRSNSTEVLDLSQNELGSDGITELCDVISSQCHEQASLHSLFLRGCQIGCKGVIAIASLLVPQHYNLEWAPLPIKTLDLSRNEIGNDGITALAKAISWDGCSLQALDLSRCNITGDRSRGLHRLFSVLRSNARNSAMASANRAYMSTKLPSTETASNLLTLKLNGNDLDSNCFNAIAACISGDSFTDDNNDGKVHYYCPSLKNLYLDNTNMSSLSAKKLAKALVTNTGLKILSLSENLIGDDAAKAFADGLRSNQTLSLLLLGRSKYITQEGVEALATCVYDESHSSALLSLAASNRVIEDFGLGKQTSIRLEHALQFNE